MEIVEVRDTNFPDARELPNKKERPVGKHQKSPGGRSGSRKDRLTGGNWLTQLQKTDREITEANKMIMWLVNGKRKFVRVSDYERLRAGF